MNNQLIISAYLKGIDPVCIEIIDQQKCPRCETGEGCGQQNWFKGFFNSKKLIYLPSLKSEKNIGDIIKLQIATKILPKIILVSYCIPFALFLFTLFISRYFFNNEINQLVLSCAVIIVSGYLCNKIGQAILLKNIKMTN